MAKGPYKMSVLKWKIIDKRIPTDVEKAYKQIINKNNFPAANQINFLQPILDIFFKDNDYVHAILLKDESPVYVFPIVRYKMKKFGITWWELGFPFHKHINLTMLHSDLSDNMFDELLVLLEDHFETWSRFAFRNIQIDSHTMEYSGDVAWFSTENELNKIVSKKNLRNIKRLEKKLITEYSSINFEFHKENLETPLTRFSKLELHSWKGDDGVAIDSDNKTKQLYENLANNDSNMFISELWINQKLIAGSIGFHISETLYIHKISYSEDFSQFAPGNILLLKLLELAIDSNDIKILNLVTRPNWANRWHPNTGKVFNYVKYRSNISGKFLKLLIQQWRDIKPRLKSILKPTSN